MTHIVRVEAYADGALTEFRLHSEAEAEECFAEECAEGRGEVYLHRAGLDEDGRIDTIGRAYRTFPVD